MYLKVSRQHVHIFEDQFKNVNYPTEVSFTQIKLTRKINKTPISIYYLKIRKFMKLSTITQLLTLLRRFLQIILENLYQHDSVYKKFNVN